MNKSNNKPIRFNTIQKNKKLGEFVNEEIKDLPQKEHHTIDEL